MSQNDLTLRERTCIYYLNMVGEKNAEIARRLGRHRATVGRELRRNLHPLGMYWPDVAEKLAGARRHAPRFRPVSGDKALMRYVENRIEADWSPQQISGRLAVVGERTLPGRSISHATIYQYLWASKERAARLRGHLRVAWRKRRKTYGKPSRVGQIPGRVSIEERPKVVDRRSRVGDWELDTIVGRKASGYVVTSVERTSRYTVAKKTRRKTASEVRQALVGAMRRLPRENVRTATADNGTEFTEHPKLARGLGIDVYFAHPYRSWERGTNENTNGLLRQYMPKGTDFGCLTDREVSEYVRRLNHRPRKCLNYRTPAEVFWSRPVARVT